MASLRHQFERSSFSRSVTPSTVDDDLYDCLYVSATVSTADRCVTTVHRTDRNLLLQSTQQTSVTKVLVTERYLSADRSLNRHLLPKFL